MEAHPSNAEVDHAATQGIKSNAEIDQGLGNVARNKISVQTDDTQQDAKDLASPLFD